MQGMGIARHAFLRESGKRGREGVPAQTSTNRDGGSRDVGGEACFQRRDEVAPLVSGRDRAAIKNKVSVVGQGFPNGAQPAFRLCEKRRVDLDACQKQGARLTM